MERIAFACFVALAALAPVPFGGDMPLARAGLPFALGLVAIAFAVGAGRAPVRLGPPGGAVWWLPAGFALVAAWAALQTVPVWPAGLAHPAWTGTQGALHPIAVDVEAARGRLLHLLGVATVFWLALQLGRDRDRARILLWALIASATLVALYGLAVTLGGYGTVLWLPQRYYSHSVTGTFVSRTHFATFAGMLAVAALALVLQRGAAVGGAGVGPLHRMRLLLDGLGGAGWLAGGAAGILLLAVTLSGSRAGAGATALGIAVLFVAMAARPQARVGPWLGGLVALLLAGTAALALGGFGEALLGRFDAAHESLEGRGAVNALILEALAARPLVGYGLGSFPTLFEATAEGGLAGLPRPYLRAHQDYLELALDLGWPAAVVLFALFAGCAWRCWHGLRTRRADWIYCAVGLAAGTVAAVHALFDFSLQLPGVAYPLAALVGLGVAQSWPRGERRSGKGPRS